MDIQSYKFDELIENITESELLHYSSSILDRFVVFLTNNKGNIVKANDKFFTTLNYKKEEIEEVGIDKVISEDANANIVHHLEKKDYWTGSLRLVDKFYRHVDTIAHILNDRNGYTIYLAAPMEVTQEQDIWKRLAYTDELTGLPNYRKFKECLSYEMDKSREFEKQFALLFIDLDDFKKINDQYGHLIGDKFLVECASRLEIATQKNYSTVFRKSGDEFLIITETGEVDKICSAIQEQMRMVFKISNNNIYGQMSVGLANFPEDGFYEESLMQSADRAMYKEKRKNKSIRI
ncbi:sensor domain-containing diguanylate cyclase [Bacillus sp. FJAT-22090]|uniref:GGDEF domain-containing protein n=1 Tax=Bacillus sp. FJAT-22090 TaxID=1581038 RepID=UPI0011A298CC|nr:sensor domain-containing diguanylate cyclase [Bacillus sp. FJAT-22090]